MVVWSTASSDEYQKIGIDLGENRDFWGVAWPGDSADGDAASTAEEQDENSAALKLEADPRPVLLEPAMDSAAPSPLLSKEPPAVQRETSDKLMSAVREIMHTAIEENLAE